MNWIVWIVAPDNIYKIYIELSIFFIVETNTIIIIVDNSRNDIIPPGIVSFPIIIIESLGLLIQSESNYWNVSYYMCRCLRKFTKRLNIWNNYLINLINW